MMDQEVLLNDLPKWSRWPERLLELESWPMPKRTPEKVSEEYNQDKYLTLQASDYVEIESLMMHLNNSKVFSKRFDINSNSQAGKTFRRVLSEAV